MAWILQTLFIIVMTTAASKSKHNFGHTSSEDFPQYYYDYTDYSPLLKRPNQSNYHNQKMIGRSTEGTNERAIERSYTAQSGTQKVQEQERRRIESRIAEPAPRIENGSYKILNYPSSSGRRGGPFASSVNDRIVFPGPSSAKYQKPDIPEQCARMGICEDVPNYPTELIGRALAELGDVRGKFQVDQLDIPDIVQRLGPPETKIELCQFDLKVVYPKGAVDKNGVFLYILNDDKNPLQGVKVEVCDPEKNVGGKCNALASFPSGYESECQQKHVTRNLWALENDKVVEKPFLVPSCCSCMVIVRNASQGF